MEGYGAGWNKPDDLVKITKMKTKKRVLQERLFDGKSPSNRAKRGQIRAKKLFQPQPPPPDETTCDDSTLMELINMKQSRYSGNQVFNTSAAAVGEGTPSSGLSTFLSPSQSSSSFAQCHPVGTSIRKNLGQSNHVKLLAKNTALNPNAVGSPLKSLLPSLSDNLFMSTPPSARKRQRITPAPPITSPLWSSKNNSMTSKTVRRVLDLSKIVEEDSSREVWHQELCMDWSVKTRLSIKSGNQFGWNTALKTSEESSGISAFVRCIDMEPTLNERPYSPPASQLDTSLGAQFNQCCLYWQHPYLPTVKLFPRDNVQGISHLTPMTFTYAGNIRLEEKALDTMFQEWVDSFRSAFQLLRTRQCPYFYVFGNHLTMLFSAAGTQGLEGLQIYVTPSSHAFRKSLKREGIDFTLPYSNANTDSVDNQPNNGSKAQSDEEEPESDDEPEKWLDEMGITQDVRASMNFKFTSSTQSDEKEKSTLLMITGDSSLAFFNFLINAKYYLVSNTGPQAGLPPTIISPVAFRGANLRSLTVKHHRVGKPGLGKTFHLELIGPILPHTIHMLCALLNKTVKKYEISLDTMASTVPLNVNKQVKSPNSKAKANVFDLQNLSDSGVKRALLEIICRNDNIDTILSSLECEDSKYKWN